MKSELFIRALKEGVVPATGCTEPVAVAYAAATAIDYLPQAEIKSVDVAVSPNIMKNAMAVIVPGTGEPGLKIASAAGIISGDSSQGLRVISHITAQDCAEIKALASSGKIKVEIAPVEDDLYVEVTIKTANDSVTVRIAGEHTNVYQIVKNAQAIKDEKRPDAHALSKTKEELQKCTFQEIWDFAAQEALEHLSFMDEAGTINMKLSQEGLRNKYGLSLGISLNDDEGKAGSKTEADLASKIVAYTAAASDARMGGAQLPAMANSESGNQGITATVPVCVVAQEIKSSPEHLTRALTLSHLTAIYIHSFLPVLSAFCAADSAAMGSAVAICYLKGGSSREACSVINNMAGDAPGMICDGAGYSCAMKVATSVSSMLRSVNLALKGITIPASNGLICDKVEDTIKGIGKLGSVGLKDTDKTILSVMMNKMQDRHDESPKKDFA